MTGLRAVLLMPAVFAERALAIAAARHCPITAVRVDSREGLAAAFGEQQDVVISFGTGVIVPESILTREGLVAVNIHAASPQYPGRDPHHFAVFDNAAEYGATLHYMTRQVDSGPIIDMESFTVPSGSRPVDLLRLANEAGFVLLERLFDALRTTARPRQVRTARWGSHRYTRAEFLELCRVDCHMPESEVARRLRAVEMPGRPNAYVEVHGNRFRFEGPIR